MTLCCQLDQLQTSVRQLESERNQVLEQLREEQHERQAAQTKLHNMQHELAMQSKRRACALASQASHFRNQTNIQ